jgi:hypothetical protein
VLKLIILMSLYGKTHYFNTTKISLYIILVNQIAVLNPQYRNVSIENIKPIGKRMNQFV